MIKLIIKNIKEEGPKYPTIILLNENYYVEPETDRFEEEKFWIENASRLANEFALFHYSPCPFEAVMREEEGVEYLRKLFEKFINGVFKRYSSKINPNPFEEIVL